MINPERLNAIKNKLKKYPFFEFLGRGKRGEVYRISNRLVAKIERDDIGAKNTAKNEYEMLKRLKKEKYFPKPKFYDSNLRFLTREYVQGQTIDKTKDKKIFIESLKLARKLDIKRINQQEMTNPYKHIFFSKNKLKMIDFERARMSKNPKNVTQFTQYIMKQFKINPEILTNSMKKYKKSNSEKDFKNIIKILKEVMQ